MLIFYIDYKEEYFQYRYTKHCEKLLAKFTAAFRAIESEFPRVEDFVRKYKLDCPAAILRIREGRPITVRDASGNIPKAIAETVSV
jgi:ESCRT-I complex subunit VPS28